MSYGKTIVILLIGLTAIASVTGCAGLNLPEVDRSFRDWTPSFSDTTYIQLPQAPNVEILDDNTILMSVEEFVKLELFVEAAISNTDILKLRNAQIQAQELQVLHLILAGRSTEQLADLYRQLYMDEANSCRLLRFGIAGTAGVLLTAVGFYGL